MSFAVQPAGSLPSTAHPHVLGLFHQQRLRGQHVLHLARADAERECTGWKVAIPLWSGGCHGFRSINGRLVRLNTQNTIDPHADRLSELLYVVHDRIGLAGHGRPYGSLRPLQDHMVRGCFQYYARIGTRGGWRDRQSSEAQGFPGVIRPDQGTPSTSWIREPTQESEVATPTAARSDPAPALVETPVPEPVAVAEAPPLVPSIEPPPPDAAPASKSDEIENFAARRKRLQARRKQARRSSRWTALILVLFAFNVALIGARSEVVRFLPQTASLFSAVGLPVNLRNLKFENMRISKEAQEGLSSLVIDGTIVSISNRPTEVPRLRFAARDAAGRRSTPGPRCRAAAFSAQEKNWISAAALSHHQQAQST